ncbi:hypothetical protein MKX08_002837, partial [Trichoderma sp. CBMAI-0020]
TTGVTPFYVNYGFTLEAYRPPCDSPNTDNARILVEDIIQLQEELKKISEVNYELDLPKNIRLKTAVFHVLLLKKALVDKEIGELIIDEIIV